MEAGGTPDEAGGGPWWPYVLIAIGIAIGAGGIALMRQRGKGEGAKAGGDDAKNEAADEGNAEDDDPRDKPAGAVDLSPCDDRRKIWEAAEQIAKEAQEAAEKAAQIEKEISDRRAGLEAELRDIRKTYPSAGKPGGGRSWAESGGRRLTERDVQMRQEAEWAAWEAYRRNPNPETAEAMQEAMNDLGSPRSEAERRELDERARRLEEELRQARKEEQLAEEALERARRRAEQARNQAEEARYKYELCIGRIRAGAGKAEPPHTGGGEPVTAGDGRGSCSCREDDPPQERNRRDLGLITFPYRVEVKMISGGDAHKAAQEAREISEGLQEVSEVLGWISLAMDIKGIGTALVREGPGWKVIGESILPLTGLATGTPTPTSIPQAVVDALRLVAQMASVIIRKVPELNERRLGDIEVDFYVLKRTVRVTCSEIWVCRGGQWVFSHRRFAVTVVRENIKGVRRETNLTWNDLQKKWEEYDNKVTRELADAMQRLQELEARCR